MTDIDESQIKTDTLRDFKEYAHQVLTDNNTAGECLELLEQYIKKEC